ncbi:hypothetical protein JYB62_06900 [Algoriphagus lutimaris]|uniref:hypothetical protein n=1 Tax=Algoriphagus lutimaris TaxID=613197 RepID=UPI00196B2A56|nr:hypothetical protein [Algoriphagus lutimaris]MBN3519727.1 hypothetical protein [Algoriphagus lutimaris]
MSIRIASSCNHCNSFSESHMCKTHDLKVSEEYTCDQFSILQQLNKSMHCNSCQRMNRADCEHPDLAAEGMLCASWAPKVS